MHVNKSPVVVKLQDAGYNFKIKVPLSGCFYISNQLSPFFSSIKQIWAI